MTRRSTKNHLIRSCFALLLCFSMLIGTTFAWFTDSVTSSGNKITSGSLKVDLELLDPDTNLWNSVKESKASIFTYNNWEPGYVDVKVLKIENEGSLAFKWKAMFVSEVELSDLANVIDVYVLPSATELGYPTDRSLNGYKRVGTVAEFVNTIEQTTYGNLLAGEVAYLGIALKMQEGAGNEYQDKTLGEFDIRIVATCGFFRRYAVDIVDSFTKNRITVTCLLEAALFRNRAQHGRSHHRDIRFGILGDHFTFQPVTVQHKQRAAVQECALHLHERQGLTVFVHIAVFVCE